MCLDELNFYLDDVFVLIYKYLIMNLIRKISHEFKNTIRIHNV